MAVAESSAQPAALAEHFGKRITPAMSALIDSADPHDPIAAQFIPSDAEQNISPHERADPIGDDAHSPIEGIVHRYPDRVLLKLLHNCAVHCRFCFRREHIGVPENALDEETTDKAIQYIATHPEIWEVILTGGDPLLLSPRRLQSVMKKLNAIPHVKIIRIHTRIPVVDPSRITTALLAALKSRCAVYILLHCNHPRELTAEARAACALLIDNGIVMLSQSVLLRGVNDSVETLAELMRAFVENRITPHYLHQGDMVRGTAHFRVPIAEGQKLMRALRGHLSGLCQPRYMLDIPGGHGKSPLDTIYAREEHDHWLIEDFRGAQHIYHEDAPL